MPIIKSAKKALRQNIKRRKINLAWKNKIKDSRKKIVNLLSKNKIQEAKKLLPDFYKVVDKAAKRGTIKKNKASRLKSQISKKFNQSSNKSNDRAS